VVNLCIITAMIYLCWIPKCPREWIRPLRTVDEMIEQARRGEGDAPANMVRLNWMVQDLQTNPMRKPIFLNDDWQTIVGDTRIMAADILGWRDLPVMLQSDIPRGEVVQDLSVCGLEGCEVITNPPGRDIFREPVEWLEIVDPASEHHMHDEQERAAKMHRYLAANTGTVFTREWLSVPIDWTLY